MSLVIGGAHQQHQQQGLGLDRLSSKRKLDDYGSTTDDDDDDDDHHHHSFPSDLISVRMRKDNEPYAVNSTSSANHVITHFEPRVSSHPQSPLQFFVRMISEGTLVLHAHSNDTVKSIHERIQSVTGIPVIEQRLIYRGKQLQWEKTLGDCSVQNDAELQLVGRMRSTHHPQAWQLIDESISIICRLCKGHQGLVSIDQVKNRITEFLNMTPRNESEKAVKHFQVFLSASVPAVLVMLYMSPYEGNKECAEEMIKLFVDSSENGLPKNVHSLCAPVVLEFCKLLGRAAADGDPLYSACRSSLGSMVECIGIGRGLNNNGKSSEEESLIVVQEIYPFVLEIAAKLSKDLELSVESPESSGPLPGDVRDFMAFLAPMRTVIKEQVGFQHSILILGEDDYRHPCYGEESKILHAIFTDLFGKMEKCLVNMEEFLAMKEKGEVEPIGQRWSQCLAILKELNSISELYEDTRERFWTILRQRKVSVCHLIVKYAKRTEDHEWLLQHKDVTDFESRRDLALMMLPEVKDEYDELHEMLIDRSQLLTESFEYIARADPETLRSGLFMEFKNEEATGPGVLREWFFLVCQAIFNPQNALFAACPNDRRRFFPNPASKVDPMHLEYFRFSGRVIALALMHKVQVGIVFDRVFFLQLAGKSVCLEDIHDADPCLYNSCKKLLEMDAEMVDSDALGLTFVQEVEELGSRKIVELCPGGKTLTVTSQNRDNYVSLLIQHRFVTSISDQVADFARGFSDILCDVRLQKLFFQSLVLEDLDWMLHGSESPISVEDWKAHTEYNGYNDTDPQIIWFWKIVEEMSAEQKKVLLFFWTSVKYLPIEGFGGLASRLHIYRSAESYNRLPSSHTCFYRLCFPPYPSMVVMEDRLRVITQEHVGCSFGTW